MIRNRIKITRAFLVALLVSAAFAVFAQPADLPPVEKINVFVVLSENIEKTFTNAASLLKEEEGIESFPLQGFQIHCTLYLAQYPVGLKDQVLAKVAELASNTKQFDISTTGLELTSGNWFFLNLERNRNLQNLSDTAVSVFSPLRSKSDYIPEWAKAFPTKMENIKKYGSPNVLTEYNPHLTFLARADAEKLQRFMKKHENTDFAKPLPGQVIAIGAAVADRDGQLPEVWQIFPLQPAE